MHHFDVEIETDLGLFLASGKIFLDHVHSEPNDPDNRSEFEIEKCEQLIDDGNVWVLSTSEIDPAHIAFWHTQTRKWISLYDKILDAATDDARCNG